MYPKAEEVYRIMATTMHRLFEATPALSIEEQANLARDLIKANELYKIFNSTSYTSHERNEALEASYNLAKEVLAHLPNDGSALNLLARAEIDKGRLSRANTLLTKALELNPLDENTLLNNGYLHIANRQYSKAETIFSDVLAINKGNVQAFSGIALAKLRQRDYLAAFNHYKRLIELGANTSNIQSYFYEAVDNLRADYYQAELEDLMIVAFSWEGIEKKSLGRMSASLIKHKYQLSDENTVLDLEQLVRDPLLLEACSYCLLPDIEVEDLLTELRKTIVTEVSLTQTLREELLPLTIALGSYSARNDYVLVRTQGEDNEITALTQQVYSALQNGAQREDVIGALLVIAMYEPLYKQNFCCQLMAYELEEWPLATQKLMQDSLYELSEEHQVQYELFGSNSESTLNNDIRRASNRWHHLSPMAKTNFYQALSQELNSHTIPKRFKHEQLNILLLGSGSGQRAAYIARYFENVSVYAVDADQNNVAYGTMMARKLGITNLQYIYADLSNALVSEEMFDIIEFGDAFNHIKSPRVAIEEWKGLLAKDGLMRFTFNSLATQETIGVVSQLVRARNLSPTTDNISHLRDAISKESESGLWCSMFEDERFYSGAGCKELFFPEHRHYFNLQSVHELLRDCRLAFIGFIDFPDEHCKEANSLAPYNLLAWHVMDQDQRLFAQNYQLYCQPC